jgi:sulfonate transport system ATP-binding protein
MLRIENVTKKFDNGFIALESINLRVPSGEIVSIIGTSGCGKSTLIRIIAGLDFPTSGSVYINDRLIEQPHPQISIIFQEPRLMPWLKVWDNVQFGLHHLPKREKDKVTEEVITKVGLAEFSQLLPRELSGGMAQRVALARALVTKPAILLLDEPFSALDALTRIKQQEHLLKVWEYSRPTMILVTHDLEEALLLSTHIVVMQSHPGHIHRELKIDLPSPRKRTDVKFQYWKEQLFRDLDLPLTELSIK